MKFTDKEIFEYVVDLMDNGKSQYDALQTVAIEVDKDIDEVDTIYIEQMQCY
jgi:hypothetical protein